MSSSYRLLFLSSVFCASERLSIYSRFKGLFYCSLPDILSSASTWATLASVDTSGIDVLLDGRLPRRAWGGQSGSQVYFDELSIDSLTDLFHITLDKDHNLPE